jgi:predicted PurR-regulated permease PerM
MFRLSVPMATKPLPKEHHPLPTDRSSRRIARVGLAIALVLCALWVAQDFLLPLSWAVIVALASWPAYRKFSAGESRV